MVEAEVRIGDLTPFRGNLHNAATALRSQVRQDSAYQLNGADQVRRDLPFNLRVTCFFSRAEQPVSRVADHYIDTPHTLESLCDYGSYRLRIRDVERQGVQLIAILCGQHLQSLRPPQRSHNLITARQQAFSQKAA